MRKMSLGELIRIYLMDRRKIIGMFVLYELIFCSIYSLYRLDNFLKLLYGVLISVFIGLCYGAWDFWHYKKRTDEISRVLKNVENLPELMPPAASLPESLYQELARALFDERQQLLFNADLKATETADYYTLWVHQVKTPIAAMKLLLQNTDKQSDSYALLQELFKIEQYVEMALHYLRLESMSSDMLIKEYELREIVSQAVKKHAVLFINSRLSFNMGEFNCTITTDEKWLLFVIEQLITNAIKYTPRGSISIYMDPNPDKKLLIIEDTGIGIRQEDLPRIFERGFTGYNGRLDKKSTGIGLYLCKQILDKLSHRIKVDSEVGKGTRVCIDFSVQSD